jgi:hypothetical protein
MNEPKPSLKLTPEDRRSRVFITLMTHWEERLKMLRSQNDGDNDALATAKLRGRIAELKLNLSLDKELPEID